MSPISAHPIATTRPYGPMSDAQGNPRRDLYVWDGIHMNAQGYAIWTSIVKAAILP